MTINTLASQVYDLLGYASINVLPATRFSYVERRVSRSRTLDGGSVVNDGGYSAGDRVIEISWTNDNEGTHITVDRMVKLHPRLVVSTVSGVFLASPERYTPGTAESRLRLLVLSQLSA